MTLFRFKVTNGSFVDHVVQVVLTFFEQEKHHEEKEILEFFLNGADISLNNSEFSEFRESDKSLRHELGPI